MPFTLSHPAAILPLHRWSNARLPLAALTIGSISPDVPYFLPATLSAESHSLLGVFYLCWPIGVTLWFVFEFLLKQPTLDLMPRSLRARFSYEKAAITGRSIFYVSIALLLGALTHIIWDSFTHSSSPVVAQFQFLRLTVLTVGGESVRLYKFLEHVSTIVGLLILAYAVAQWWRSTREFNHSLPNRLSAPFRSGAIAAIVLVSLASAVIDYRMHPHGAIERKLFFISIGGMTGFTLAWCAVAMVIALRRTGRY